MSGTLARIAYWREKTIWTNEWNTEGDCIWTGKDFLAKRVEHWRGLHIDGKILSDQTSGTLRVDWILTGKDYLTKRVEHWRGLQFDGKRLSDQTSGTLRVIAYWREKIFWLNEWNTGKDCILTGKRLSDQTSGTLRGGLHMDGEKIFWLNGWNTDEDCILRGKKLSGQTGGTLRRTADWQEKASWPNGWNTKEDCRLTGTGFLAQAHFEFCLFSLSCKPEDLLFSPDFFAIYTYRDTAGFTFIRSNISTSALYLSIPSLQFIMSSKFWIPSTVHFPTELTVFLSNYLFLRLLNKYLAPPINIHISFSFFLNWWISWQFMKVSFLLLESH